MYVCTMYVGTMYVCSTKTEVEVLGKYSVIFPDVVYIFLSTYLNSIHTIFHNTKTKKAKLAVKNRFEFLSLAI